MAVSIISNINALRAQRQLARSVADFSSASERLASGQRINRASDDAAGLAISSRLNSDTRVFTQAIRNANDGISALNIAEGSVSQLSGILIRLKELAQGAANGSLSLSQRRSIDLEAKALTEEFNRTLDVTKFNKQRLIDGTLNELSIQLGYGIDARLSSRLGEGLSRYAGDGTFNSGTSTVVSSMTGTAMGDVDGDGDDDLVTAQGGGFGVRLRLSNGDGTFASETSILSGTLYGVALKDVNKDGKLDIIGRGSGATAVQVVLGLGDGSFSASSMSTSGGGNTFSDLSFADFNNDGFLDIVAPRLGSSIELYLNDGTGRFNSPTSYAALSGSTFNVKAGDINGDGNADLVLSDSVNGVAVRYGNGQGGLGASQAVSGISAATGLQLQDVNHDGVLDLITSESGTLNVRINSGNGTFQSAQSYSGHTSLSLLAGDINGDGYVDLVSDEANQLSVLLNNGDGTFTNHTTSTAITARANSGSLGDFSADGVLDLVHTSSATTTMYTRTSRTNETNTLGRPNLTTQAEALLSLDELDEAISRTVEELGNIGSAQSRLRSALNNLLSSRENYSAASSRITDADVASESAKLVVSRIRQQVAQAVLVQANQIPAIAVSLLSEI